MNERVRSSSAFQRYVTDKLSSLSMPKTRQPTKHTLMPRFATLNSSKVTVMFRIPDFFDSTRQHDDKKRRRCTEQRGNPAVKGAAW